MTWAWAEFYKCNLCSCVWSHEWEEESCSDDYTFCPECQEFEWSEITLKEYTQEMYSVDAGGPIDHGILVASKEQPLLFHEGASITFIARDDDKANDKALSKLQKVIATQ